MPCIIGRYLAPALVTLALLWPFSALAAHLEDSSSVTAHVRDLGDGEWQAAFRVELWSDSTGKSSVWGLIINQQGCRMTPLGPPRQESSWNPTRTAEVFIPWVQ